MFRRVNPAQLHCVVRNLELALSEFQADVVVYNAGTDILEGDSLGLLSISEQVSLKTDVALRPIGSAELLDLRTSGGPVG